MFDLAFACQSIPSKLCDLNQGIASHPRLQFHFIPQIHKTRTSLEVQLSGGGFYAPRYETSLWTHFDEQDISFLKINPFEIPHNTAQIIRRITKAFVESDIKSTQGDINIEQVLDVIHSEYKSFPVPFLLGGRLFDLKRRQEESTRMALEVFSKIISFAAINRLPKELVIFLFGRLEESSRFSPETKEQLEDLIATFVEDKNSWTGVEFPQGLSLQLKRNFVVSKREKYYPLPRKSFLTLRNDALEAKKALKEADLIEPPMKLAKKEDIERIANNLSIKSGFASEEGSLLRDSMLTFFPKENRILVGLRRIMSTQKSKKLKDASIVGLFSYGLITVLSYTLYVIGTWSRLRKGHGIIVMGGEMQPLRHSLKTFGAVLGKASVQLRITQIPRWSLAVVLSPPAKILLQRVQKRFQVSNIGAVRIIATYLAGVCIGLCSLLIMLDAFLSSPTRNHLIL